MDDMIKLTKLFNGVEDEADSNEDLLAEAAALGLKPPINKVTP